MDRNAALLIMASNVYGDRSAIDLPSGEITRLSMSPELGNQPDIGFRAEAYRIEATGEIVVAIAGTNTGSIPSLVNAAAIGLTVLPEQQITAAEAFVQEVTAQYGAVTLVGHSSGGLVSQLLTASQALIAEESQLPINEAWGFNSPGAAPFLPTLFGSNPIPETFDNVHSICDSRDVVCRVFDERGGNVMGNSHIGTVQFINSVHDSEPAYGLGLFNPMNWPDISHDLAVYHSIDHLLLEHGQTVPVPVEVGEGVGGAIGLDMLTMTTGEICEAIQEGGEEFETFQTSSPLVLDLDRDGIETVGLLAGAFFDHAGDGFAELTGWVGTDDGVLALDRNGNGAVDHGGELFGNETLLQSGAKAADGYQALAEFDQNADGRIDASDPIWAQLRVWRDADGNGDSAGPELHALPDVGVSAISTGATASTFIDGNGNEHRLVGSFTRSDTSVGETADVWFRVARRASVASEYRPVPAEVSALPNVQAYGTVHGLHQAIVRDTGGSLKGLVKGFVGESDPAARAALLEQIVFKWTGSETVDPDSRGPYIDARRLTVLERVYGDGFIGIEGTGNPNAEVGGLLNRTYQGFAELVYAQLMAQSHLKDLWMQVTYSWDDAAARIRGDMSAVLTELQDLIAADPAAGRATLGEFARTVRGLGVEAMVDYQTFRDSFAAQGEDLAWIVDSGGKVILAGAAGDDTLTGTATADALQGGDGNDTLSGEEGEDTLYGQAGADSLVGGADDDVLDGGSGNDSLDGRRGNDWLLGQADNDTLLGEAGDDVLEGGDGDDSLQGGEGHDTLLGSAGADSLSGNEGDDSLSGGDGDDTLSGDRDDDTLVGGDGDDTIMGSGGADSLEGGAGHDSLDGGSDNDTLDGGAGIDALVGDNGDDTLRGGSEGDSLSGNAGNDILYGGPDGDVLFGDRDSDILHGEAGNDRLVGGFGIDAMVGGAGNDTYDVDDGADTVVETAGEGDDAVEASVTYTLPENVERLTLTVAAAINGTGNALDNVLIGHFGANTLSGGAGDDVLSGGPGADVLVGGPGSDTYLMAFDADAVTELPGEGTDTIETWVTAVASDHVENLTLKGTVAIDGTGNALDNVLTGSSASNRLDGGAGADTMAGGMSSDLYIVDQLADMVVEAADEGPSDTIEASLSYTLPANVEVLRLTGETALEATGNALDNRLSGNGAPNRLDGGSGADIMTGGANDDIYIVDDVADVVVELPGEGTDGVQSSVTYGLQADVDNLTLTGTGAIDGAGNALDNRLTGNSGANRLSGGGGDDTLEGGAGADALVGGPGNDTYVVAEAGDVVTELAGEGTDAIHSSVTYTLPSDVENLVLSGLGIIDGTGNALNNRLTGGLDANTLKGGAGDDVLDGGSGADTLVGGTGNDAYVVADAADIVTELANQGTDTVESSVTYALPVNVEHLTLTGTAAVNGTGNVASNALRGNGAANRLSGGAGVDMLVGGAGDDTYVVDHVAETVTEAANEGTDTVESDVTYVLPTNVERLTLTGSGAINGTGNALSNTLTGNAKANVLDGGVGADAMIGGAGNDTYVVDDVADAVTEGLNQGTDTIQSAVSYTLPDNVEKLTLTGAVALDGFGNASNNTLTGNGAANLLDGGSGTDIMSGGAGDDTYVVERTGDIVHEASNAGIDTVRSSVSYTLPANVENLTLTGTGVINGVGNTLANVLHGNSAANLLEGRTGNDTYLFGRGAGQDAIRDVDTTSGNRDTLACASDLDPLDLILSRNSNNLRIAVHGSSDRVDIQYWYGGVANQVEVIRAGDGRQLLSTQVEQLIQAMASYGAQTGLTWEQAVAQRPEEVEAILAAHWQPAGV